MDPQDFGYLDPDPDPRGKKINQKLQKKTFEKKEIIKISSFQNGSSSFRIKISEKLKQYLKIIFC